MSQATNPWRAARLKVEAAEKEFQPIGRIYTPPQLPPGAVPVADRVLPRFVQVGASQSPHGVPPIGTIGLPAGWVINDEFADDSEIRVMPFRFPWYSRAYALRAVNGLFAIVRNVSPFELSPGHQVVVQYNDMREWMAIFGRIKQLGTGEMTLELPSDEQRRVGFAEIHFVGRVVCWWNESAVVTYCGK